ncbi:MAG: hypothetical protein KDD42_06005, partial [Bdellovibrionales bacterium]|nr:hypothetical protein [Bdellovibrionales bacterium]
LSDLGIGQASAAFGDTTVRLLAPVLKSKKGSHKAIFQRARRSEIAEVRVDGNFAPVGAFDEGLERNKTHSIDFVWAKFIPSRIPQKLIVEAVREVFAISGGVITIHENGRDTVFSAERACPVCQKGFFRPDPEDLSFHSKRGRCEKCGGTGVLKGKQCSACSGTRLSPIGRSLRIEDLSISDLCQLSASEVLSTLNSVSWTADEKPVVEPVLREINARLQSLCDLGLDYLPLDRGCAALSSGELQRLRLAAAMGTPLSGAMYIFDEPSAGLHPRDTLRVLEKLTELRDQGNSILVIEHDEESILSADYIIEVGPGGGRDGGQIVFSGSREKYDPRRLEPSESAGEVVEEQRTQSTGTLSISRGNCHTVKDLSLRLPLGNLVAVTGVSGSGKSSFVHGIVEHTLVGGERVGDSFVWTSDVGEVSSDVAIDRVLVVDQSPIGKNSRSTPASYLKIWDHIRTVFADTLEAR